MNLQAIYPPAVGLILKACTSCGGDVKTDRGFADLDGEPFKAYLCAGCAVTAVGGNRCAELLQAAQERHRRSLC